VLPECFNSPYSTAQFRRYAEPVVEDAPTYLALSALSKRLSITLIAGSIPEIDTASDRVYNTSLAFGPTGALLAKHRKVHLFDIDVPGGVSFRESDALSAGSTPSVVPTKWGNVGLAICYDVRFPELAMIAARKHNAFLMVYPSAFNLTTGPMHWDLLARARAVDNQIYVAMASPARLSSQSESPPELGSHSSETEYIPWGASMVVDPNGEILAQAGIAEETVYAELLPERIAKVRGGIPVTTQRRFDVYCDVSATDV
jgi:omega-amidase